MYRFRLKHDFIDVRPINGDWMESSFHRELLGGADIIIHKIEQGCSQPGCCFDFITFDVLYLPEIGTLEGEIDPWFFDDKIPSYLFDLKSLPSHPHNKSLKTDAAPSRPRSESDDAAGGRAV